MKRLLHRFGCWLVRATETDDERADRILAVVYPGARDRARLVFADAVIAMHARHMEAKRKGKPLPPWSLPPPEPKGDA